MILSKENMKAWNDAGLIATNGTVAMSLSALDLMLNKVRDEAPITDAQGVAWFEAKFGVPIGDKPGAVDVAGVMGDLEKAIGDRDALRQAIGFKPGALKEDRDADIVIIDAKALRPAMVEARRAKDDAQARLATIHAYAGEEIRAWVKERFGKWITYKSAWTLADRLFGSERAVPTKSQQEA